MAKRKSTLKIPTLVRWRPLVQAVFALVWINPWLRLHGVCSPVFHCHSCPWALFACPIGMIANFSAVGMVSYAALGTLFVYGIVFGTFICGWVCPFGFLQDLLGKVPTPKFELPAWAGYFRYVVLVVFVLAAPFFLGKSSPLFFCNLCPAGALGVSLPYGVWPNAAKITITAVILVAVFFKRRPWCTVFCPLGAIYSLFNRVSIFFPRFHAEKCHDCELCKGKCPCSGTSERRAGVERCVRCLECVQCKAITMDCVFVGQDDPEGGSRAPQSDW
ncbi:MAG: 4Fe-4S binding protein [Candidatus Nealsonbacteria bacterium]|nr:4Fe-4S binding protein [Candidatus Nealsonbacteria bacterium]